MKNLGPLTHVCLQLIVLNVAIAAEPDEAPSLFQADITVPMRDGTKLAANVFLPREAGRFPTILTRTPYGKADQHSDEAKRYTAAGYAFVAQDCRGRGKSEGLWEPFRFDVEDGFDTQEWVSRQSWSNGDIGTSGGSYVGWTQWASAPNASSHLKAMVPAVPFANAFEVAYCGGAFQLALLMGWGTGVGGVTLNPDQLQKAYLHLPLADFGNQFEKKVPYLNDWIQHAQYDDYWKKRGIDYRFSEVTVPILNIGGWYDIFSKTTLDLVNQVRAASTNHLVRRNQFAIIGPWTHGIGTRKAGELDFGADAQLKLYELQFKWFEYWLKGRDTGVQDWPAYYLFVMGENQWRGENEWPLKRTRFTSYFLHSSGHANSLKGDGSLTSTEPDKEESDNFTYDPKDPVPSLGGNNLIGASAGPYDQTKVEERQDVLVYSTAPLDKEIEVTGPVKLLLYADSSARDTDFSAKLVDVHPDQKPYNLCEGIIRARYRHGLENPELLEPKKIEPFEVDLWVTSNIFKRDHRIRLEISSSNFPRFDRNPNSGKPFGTDTELFTASQIIVHDKDHPSHLILPVIPN